MWYFGSIICGSSTLGACVDCGTRLKVDAHRSYRKFFIKGVEEI